jgi:hypothetical protein
MIKNIQISGLLLIIISLVLLNCKSKNLEEKDYIIKKADSEKAILILFPCFPCDKINTKSEAKFLDKIEDSGITTILLDYNQKLYLDDFEKEELAEKLQSILTENDIKSKNIFIGGFSSGGNITILLSNYLIKNQKQIQPKGIFIVDSPLDLEQLYKSARNDIQLNKNIEAVEEGRFLVNLFEQNLGNPETSIEKYKNSSPYLISQNSTNNIKYLKNIKVRFYTEPDLEWQSLNRDRKYEDLNAYKVEKTWEALEKIGNNKAEFIKTENLGVRANGEKHPHSWNIVEREDLIKWILE